MYRAIDYQYTGAEKTNIKTEGKKMKKKKRKERKISLSVVTLIILISSLFSTPITLANDQIGVSFNPRFNEPPDTPINSYPVNGTVDIRVPVTLEVLVRDESSSTVNVYFYNASDNSLIGTDNNVPVPSDNWYTATVEWSGIQKGKIYTWYTVVNDSEYENTSETWIFATRPNQPPIIHNNEYPANESENIGLQITCRIEVSDEDVDTMNIYWYENSTGDWVLRQTNSSVTNGTYYWTNLQATSYSTKYYWKVVVNDSIHNTSAIYHFTTAPNQPVTISNPSPANQSTDVSISTSYWNVTIEDPENETFNWTIETSPDIGSNSSNIDTTGVKTINISGNLSYSTTYTMFVNATDAGSGNWSNETFWFETAEPGAPTLSNEYPANRSTHIGRQPTCHVDADDLEGDTLTLYWYEKSTGSWVLRQTDNNVPAGSTVYWTFSQASSYSTIYYWKVVVDDGSTNTTYIYHFTTEPEPSSPGGGSPGGGNSYIPPPNQAPIANITGPNIGYVNENVIFGAYYSYDRDGYIIGYRWDFNNDGLFDTEWLEDLFINHTYSSPGDYTVKLQVKDDDGLISRDSYTITIIELMPDQKLPIAIINVSYEGLIYENISFSGADSYDPDGTIVTYIWDFGDYNTSNMMKPVHSYSKPGDYVVVLTVIDDDNLISMTITTIHIRDPKAKEPGGPKEVKKQPLLFLLILIMAIIVTVLVIIFRKKGHQVALFIKKLGKSKKNKNENVEAAADKLRSESNRGTAKNIEAKVDKILKMKEPPSISAPSHDFVEKPSELSLTLEQIFPLTGVFKDKDNEIVRFYNNEKNRWTLKKILDDKEKIKDIAYDKDNWQTTKEMLEAIFELMKREPDEMIELRSEF